MPPPQAMRVVEVPVAGPADSLTLGERPVPEPGPNELLVKVRAAGINRADIMQRNGHYPPPSGASDVLGLEVSGTVASLGVGVTEWSLGDTVCALVTGGGYAEYCVVPVPQCLPVPSSVDLVDAAALPEACLTVWTNVFERGRLRAGERFLVHGGSSGIGTTAIQLARLAGARVLVTAGTDDKCAACLQLGAEHAINYRESEFAPRVKEATDGDGVDLILDMVGGPYLEANLSCLSQDGRIVIIGLMGGSRAELNLATLMSRRLLVTGSTLRARSVAQKGAIRQEVQEHVWPWVIERRFRPVVASRFALDDVAAAHRLMESSRHIGKILLTLDE